VSIDYYSIRNERHPVHAEALAWVNALVLDLKLQLLGEESQMSAPITMERLSEWHGKHARDVEQCKEERWVLR
jgi:hypothetical protein